MRERFGRLDGRWAATETAAASGWRITAAMNSAAVVLHRAASSPSAKWMEARGWVYWRKRKGLKQALERAMQDGQERKNVRPAQAPPFDVNLEAGTVTADTTGQISRSVLSRTGLACLV